MTFFGTRRSRHTRVFRPTQSWWERLQDSLQDYRTVKQLLIGIIAVGVLLLAMQAWRTRFPYREGQFATYGVLSRVDFSVPNALETQRVRRDAEEKAAWVFVKHNDVIDNLIATFRSQLSDVANAESLAELVPSVAEAFGIRQDAEGFDRLHTLLTETESVGAILDRLVGVAVMTSAGKPKRAWSNRHRL